MVILLNSSLRSEFLIKKKRKSVTNRKIFFYRGLVFGLPLNFFDLISLKWLNIKFNYLVFFFFRFDMLICYLIINVYWLFCNLATSQDTFEQTTTQLVLSSDGFAVWAEKQKSTFQSFFPVVKNNPYTFLNLRHLYLIMNQK